MSFMFSYCRKHTAMFAPGGSCPLCDRDEPAIELTTEQAAIADRFEADPNRRPSKER